MAFQCIGTKNALTLVFHDVLFISPPDKRSYFMNGVDSTPCGDEISDHQKD